MKANRLHYLDAAKGFGMLAIIAGHMGYPAIDKFVFTFHVPLFFLICGYLYRYRNNYIHRLRHMLVPYFTTSIILLVLTDCREILKGMRSMDYSPVVKNTIDYAFASIYGSGVRKDLFSYQIKPIGAIWFLMALLVCQLVFDAVNQIFKKDRMIALGTVSMVLALASIISAKYTWLPFSIQSAGVGCLFMYSGLLIKKYSLENKEYMIWAGIAIWGVAILCSYKYGNMSIAECLFPNSIINIIGAVMGSYIIIRCFSWVERKNSSNTVWNKLCVIGEYSTIVLCVHLIEIRVVPWHFLKEQNLIFMPCIIFFIKIAIALLSATIAQKYRNQANRRKGIEPWR